MTKINKTLLLNVCKARTNAEDKLLTEVVNKACIAYPRADFNTLVDCVIEEIEQLIKPTEESETPSPPLSFIRDWTATWK
ncbi:hypothetical protein VP496E541_P0054 [Vibrio phage 496E54-1]|nr:hypothetical protein VP495E541_P0054 [Vibrio phage 495E54-1]CAH9012764.1 hypothetical protein VP496E541_P0054 [Vibrio phage 496E54-1]